MNFCSHCGTLLEYLPTKVVCRKCSWECPYNMFKSKESEKVITFVEEIVEEKEELDTQALTNETCPRCGHNQLMYTTRQMRSADEGQTVFYECPKCHYRFSENN